MDAPSTPRRPAGVALLARLHEELEAPARSSSAGARSARARCTRAARGSALFDIQQHTYSHVVFRDVHYRRRQRGRGGAAGDAGRRPPRGARLHSELIRKYLGREWSASHPFGYYRGPRRPDLSRSSRRQATSYVTSWGRNEQNGNPTPWAEPFTYAEEGFPEILETPFQFWLDGIWFDAHGYGEGRRSARR